jgi:hypothetical protein
MDKVTNIRNMRYPLNFLQFSCTYALQCYRPCRSRKVDSHRLSCLKGWYYICGKGRRTTVYGHSSRRAGNDLIEDSRLIHQDRCITIKSTAISLYAQLAEDDVKDVLQKTDGNEYNLFFGYY